MHYRDMPPVTAFLTLPPAVGALPAAGAAGPTFFLTVPSSTVRTRPAKLRLQYVSSELFMMGEAHTIMRVLLSCESESWEKGGWGEGRVKESKVSIVSTRCELVGGLG